MRTSSVIAGVAYDPRSHTLEVEFRTGRVYDYFGVPKSEYRALLNAPSLGSYFNRKIRNRYRTREVLTASSRRSSPKRAQNGRYGA
jgi:KTSC domain